jgi:hypothetical protein
VLNTLPISSRRLFFARIAAIAVLIAGFLFDANVLATMVRIPVDVGSDSVGMWAAFFDLA